MDTLYNFLDNITHYKTKSVHFWGLMNSATKRTWRTTSTAKLISGERLEALNTQSVSNPCRQNCYFAMFSVVACSAFPGAVQERLARSPIRGKFSS